jgi:hypothetical protein
VLENKDIWMDGEEVLKRLTRRHEIFDKRAKTSGKKIQGKPAAKKPAAKKPAVKKE